MTRSSNYAISQFESVKNYIKNLGVNKPIHIGETGWASISSDNYGQNGTRAADEYKQYLYYSNMIDYGNKNNISSSIFQLLMNHGKTLITLMDQKIILVYSLLMEEQNMLCGKI